MISLTNPPRGLLRFGLRLPIWLYRLHLGWLLGDRFLMLTHIGRKSGQPRHTVVEVVKHDSTTDSYYVVSGWGEKADWYQNIHKQPDAVIVAGRRKLPVHAEDVPVPASAAIIAEYARRNPKAFQELSRMFLHARLEPGSESSRILAERMPMIVFHPRSQDVTTAL